MLIQLGSSLEHRSRTEEKREQSINRPPTYMKKAQNINKHLKTEKRLKT